MKSWTALNINELILKPQLLKRNESQSGIEPVYTPRALPGGHIGSLLT